MVDHTDYEYANKLAITLKEYAISISDLARAMKVTDKTVSRWVHGECSISPKKRTRIEQCIAEITTYQGYMQRTADEFGKLYSMLYSRFKGAVTQEQLGKMTRMGGQSQMSKIAAGTKKTSAEEQYRILTVFLTLCGKPSKSGVTDQLHIMHLQTARFLCRILGLDMQKVDWFEDALCDTSSDLSFKYQLIEQLLTLPVQAQEIILSAPLAFFDFYQIIYFDDVSRPYQTAEGFLNRFLTLSVDQRRWFQYEMELFCARKRVGSYYDHDDNRKLFDMVTDYRFMIKNARERRIGDPEGSRIGWGRRLDGFVPIQDYNIRNLCAEDEDYDLMMPFSFSMYRYFSDDDTDESQEAVWCRKQIKRFETVLDEIIQWSMANYDDADSSLLEIIVNDIEHRLCMSPYEWYIWMLYASYVYSYQEDDSIHDLLETVQSEEYENPGI